MTTPPVPTGIDAARVTAWFGAEVPAARPPLRFELIAGGHSNLTFVVTDSADRRWVLRRPPLGHLLATAHDMAREHRIMSSLGGSDVPVPRTVGLCEDTEVNGAPFYVMDHVDGIVVARRRSGAGPDAVAAGAGGAGAGRDARPDPPRRRRRGRPRRPRSSRHLHRPPAQALEAAVRAVAHPRPAGDRPDPRPARPSGSPSNGVSASSTATTASTTSSSTTPARSSRCSTGSCARSATSSSTSVG